MVALSFILVRTTPVVAASMSSAVSLYALPVEELIDGSSRLGPDGICCKLLLIEESCLTFYCNDRSNCIITLSLNVGCKLRV